MLSKLNPLVATLISIGLLTGVAQAQAKTYVLKDPVTQKPLANTPYFLFFNGDSTQPKPLMTDAKGRTKANQKRIKDAEGGSLPLKVSRAHQMYSGDAKDFNNPLNDNILVRAQGDGAQVFVTSLNNLASDAYQNTNQQLVSSGTPYVIWNRESHQAVCGDANTQGYSNAYFVDDSAQWYTNSMAFTLKNRQPCAEIAQVLTRWVYGQNEGDAAYGDVYVRQHFAMSDAQMVEVRKFLMVR